MGFYCKNCIAIVKIYHIIHTTLFLFKNKNVYSFYQYSLSYNVCTSSNDQIGAVDCIAILFQSDQRPNINSSAKRIEWYVGYFIDPQLVNRIQRMGEQEIFKLGLKCFHVVYLFNCLMVFLWAQPRLRRKSFWNI